MEGILIPVLGGLMGGILGLLCLSKPRLRRYFLAAVVAPITGSVVFLLGSFWLADMNPAREYGPAYIPTGREHDPTSLDYLLWLSALLGTIVVSAIGSYLIQGVTLNVLKIKRDSTH